MGLYQNMLALFECGALDAKSDREIARILGISAQAEKKALSGALGEFCRGSARFGARNARRYPF